MPRSARPLRAGVLSAAVVGVPAAGALAVARAGLHVGARALEEADPGGALLGLAAVALSGVLAWAAAAAAAGVVEAWSRTGPVRARTAGGGSSVGPRPGDQTARAGGRGRGGMVSAGVAALVVAALTAPGAAASTGPAGRPAVVAGQDATASDSSPAGTTAPDPSPVTGPTSTGPTSTGPTSTGPTSSMSAPTDGGPGPTTTVTPSALPSGAGGGDGPGTSAPGAQVAASTETAPVAATEAPPGSWSALASDGFRAPRGSGVDSAALVTAPALRPTGATDRVGPAPAAVEVVVLAGDSLWSLAARHLGPGADASEVAEAWPRWWEANRAVVGEDPDLLLPGQRLVAPLP